MESYVNLFAFPTCSPFKNFRFISVQVLSVAACILTVAYAYIGADICAGIAMIILLVASCRNMKPVSPNVSTYLLWKLSTFS